MATRLIKTIKKILLKLTPEWVLLTYHGIWSWLAEAFNGFPSHKMIIIGITGTKGKTSTANFLHQILQTGGLKTGLISTANLKVGSDEQLNYYHMSMPGRGRLQKLIKKMAAAGCQVCIVEVTSEGLKQNRHWGLWFDMAIFTNLTPEHLPSHKNSFEYYKQAKLKLFKAVANRPTKKIEGQYQPRLIIANKDSEHYPAFTNFVVDKIISYSQNQEANLTGQVAGVDDAGFNFTINNQNYHCPIPGAFNLPNILAAVAAAKELGIGDEAIKTGLAKTNLIPGRMEEIKNNLGFKVFIDYAHEKESMSRVLEAGRTLAGKHRVIVLLGAEGGGRDKSKRVHMAQLADQLADFSIVTNVDPYEDDPQEIADDIARHFTNQTKVKIILDRKAAIKEAILLAKPGDVVLITGKGAEQSMIINGKSTPWDDRLITREILAPALS